MYKNIALLTFLTFFGAQAVSNHHFLKNTLAQVEGEGEGKGVLKEDKLTADRL